MNKRARLTPEDTRSWSVPADGEEQPVVGYGEALASAIAEGLEDKRVGRVKPAEKVWKELGLE